MSRSTRAWVFCSNCWTFCHLCCSSRGSSSATEIHPVEGDRSKSRLFSPRVAELKAMFNELSFPFLLKPRRALQSEAWRAWTWELAHPEGELWDREVGGEGDCVLGDIGGKEETELPLPGTWWCMAQGQNRDFLSFERVYEVEGNLRNRLKSLPVHPFLSTIRSSQFSEVVAVLVVVVGGAAQQSSVLSKPTPMQLSWPQIRFPLHWLSLSQSPSPRSHSFLSQQLSAPRHLGEDWPLPTEIRNPGI